MAQLATPIIFLNLSSQMLFVLDERLKSQSAAADRILALLSDIIDGMFENTWVESMFSLKNVPPLPSVYATFSHFAHSSMMTLSASRWALHLLASTKQLSETKSTRMLRTGSYHSFLFAAWRDFSTSCVVESSSCCLQSIALRR